jgi:hypothetical protein
MKHTSVVAFAVLIFSSCKNQDENKPLLEYVRVNNVDNTFLYAEAGESITIQVKTSDDVGLKQIKLKVITQTGLHNHTEEGTETHAFSAYNQGEWDTLVIYNIGGKENLSEFNFNVPNTVSGEWKLEIGVLDEEGNLNSENRSLHIQNNFIPIIAIGQITPAPNSDGVIPGNVGGNVVIDGSVLDDELLTYVSASIYKGTDTLWTSTNNNVNTQLFSLNGFIPTVFANTGKYTYSIVARDNGGRENKAVATIVVN